MPFRKVGPDKYQSPSGKVFTSKQVALYHATDGFTKAPRAPKPTKGKGK